MKIKKFSGGPGYRGGEAREGRGKGKGRGAEGSEGRGGGEEGGEEGRGKGAGGRGNLCANILKKLGDRRPWLYIDFAEHFVF